jgi:hypothetical protein
LLEKLLEDGRGAPGNFGEAARHHFEGEVELPGEDLGEVQR